MTFVARLGVVGGILFAVGVADRSYLMSDDAVHWFSWAGLGAVGVGLASAFATKFYMKREPMEDCRGLACVRILFALVIGCS